MPYEATVYRVLVASPGDVKLERKAATNAILEWNLDHSADRRIVFLPRLWELHVPPAMGASPQVIVNREIVDDADLLIGIFWMRLGTPTATERSGTVEEIQRVLERQGGDNVLLYFSAKKEDPYKVAGANEEFERLRDFREECRRQGLFQEFRSTAQLKELVARHLDGRAQRLENRASNENRLARIETMARQANTETAIQKLGGACPLDTHFIREDMARKACLSLARIGPIRYDRSDAEISVDVRNEGDYPAYDVRFGIDFGSGFPPDDSPAGIAPAMGRVQSHDNTRTFSFRMPRPSISAEGDAMESQRSTVRLRWSFRDGLNKRDEAIYTLRFRNQGGLWKVAEDEAAAILSPLCRHLRPNSSPERARPKNLTDAEHNLLAGLLRRYIENPGSFLPTLEILEIGDNLVHYALGGPIGTVMGGPYQNPEHHRDFTPTLVRQGYLIPAGRPGDYMIDDSLFRAYGLLLPGGDSQA